MRCLNKIEQQLKKGLLEIAILSILEERDCYGYELIHELDILSEGVFILKEGTLYPILYRLEDNKHIQNYWKTEDATRSKPRKYYKITSDGKKLYKEAKDSFYVISNGFTNIINRKY